MRKRVVANGRRAIVLVGRVLRVWRRGARRLEVGRQSSPTDGQSAHRNALDRLIDGRSMTITGSKGEELGYLIGYTSRKISNSVRMLLLTDEVPRVELEAWRAQISDLSRDMPDEVTMIFWEGLPLAVWCPAGHLKEFSFNPN